MQISCTKNCASPLTSLEDVFHFHCLVCQGRLSPYRDLGDDDWEVLIPNPIPKNEPCLSKKCGQLVFRLLFRDLLQGTDFYNHFWKFLVFVSPWQFLAVWHHPKCDCCHFTQPLSTLYALLLGLVLQELPMQFWDCSELCCIHSSPHHPLEGCKEEVNQEERKKKLKLLLKL